MDKVFKNCKIYDTDTKNFSDGDIRIHDCIISEIGNVSTDGAEVINLGEKYVIPGLVDVHTHGRGGYDFNTIKKENFDDIAYSYASVGTTTVMPTLASDTLDSMMKSTSELSEYEAKPGLAAFVGTHLEGRYLSVKKRGAHAIELLSSPSADEIKEFNKLRGNKLLRLSVAPELEGSREMIKAALDCGVTVTAAHTDADGDELKRSLTWGITGFTHTYNCMRPIHHRDPGGAGVSLTADNAYSEFICDGFHICPDVIKLSYRAKDKEHFVLVTDSMEAAGCPDGQYSIGGLPVNVVDGKAVNSEGAIAGSTLDLFTAVVNLMKFCGITLEEALPCATVIPARMIGAENICGSLKQGMRADFIVIADRQNPVRECVYAGGTEVCK